MYNMMNCLPCMPAVVAAVVPVNHVDEAEKSLQAAPVPIKMEKPLQAAVQVPVKMAMTPVQAFPVPTEMEKLPLQAFPVPTEMEKLPLQAVQAPEETKKKKTCPAAANRKVRFADEEGKKDAVRITVVMTKKEVEQLLFMLAGGGRTLEDLVSEFKAAKLRARASEHEGCRKSPEIVNEGYN